MEDKVFVTLTSEKADEKVNILAFIKKTLEDKHAPEPLGLAMAALQNDLFDDNDKVNQEYITTDRKDFNVAIDFDIKKAFDKLGSCIDVLVNKKYSSSSKE